MANRHDDKGKNPPRHTPEHRKADPRQQNHSKPEQLQQASKADSRKHDAKHRREGEAPKAESHDYIEAKKRKDRPELPDQNKIDPNRSVRNASNTVVIQGHPCAKVCQKLGFSNCRCQEKNNIRNLFIAITILLQQLKPVNWQIFNRVPAWVKHPHRKHSFRFAPYEEQDKVIDQQDPMDLYLVDEDLYPEFELTNDPFVMILRAKVPHAVISREFESFLKILASEMPDVNDYEQLYEMGYQLRQHPETGVTAIRMPDPAQQLRFMLHLASKGCLCMEQHQVLESYTRMMQARYGGPAPRPVPGMPKRRDLVEEMMAEQREGGRFNPTPLKTKLALDPHK